MDPRVDILVAFLDQRRRELRAAFDEVPAAARETQPAADAWSAANVIEHLADTERLVSRLLAALGARAPIRPPGEAWDRQAFEANIDMPHFLDRSRRLRLSQPSGALDSRAAWLALEDSRRTLLAALDAVRGRRLEDVARDHPATEQPLDGYQWAAFVGLHEARHAAQLRAIAASF